MLHKSTIKWLFFVEKFAIMPILSGSRTPDSCRRHVNLQYLQILQCLMTSQTLANRNHHLIAVLGRILLHCCNNVNY